MLGFAWSDDVKNIISSRCEEIPKKSQLKSPKIETVVYIFMICSNNVSNLPQDIPEPDNHDLYSAIIILLVSLFSTAPHSAAILLVKVYNLTYNSLSISFYH